MSLIKCKECGEQVSDKAKTCPKCGAPPKKPSSNGCAVVVILFFAVAMFVGSVFRSPDQSTRSSVSASGPPAPEKPRVLLLSFRCESDSIGNSYVVGEAKNVSPGRIAALSVSASFYDAKKELIGSGSSYVDIMPLLPGQKSAFKAYGPRNPLVNQCSITSFKDGPWGGALAWDSK